MGLHRYTEMWYILPPVASLCSTAATLDSGLALRQYHETDAVIRSLFKYLTLSVYKGDNNGKIVPLIYDGVYTSSHLRDAMLVRYEL